jgi:hypothetical protein
MAGVSSPVLAGPLTDPFDNLVVLRLAGCDAFDETGVGLDIL